MKGVSRRTLVHIAVSGLAILYPWIVPSGYYVAVAINVGIFALLSLGVVLLWGQTGLLTLGQGAFFGIGAYTSSILTMSLGWAPPAALGAGIALTVLVAAIVGLTVLRLEKFYFAVATLGFNYVAFTVFDGWESFTKGSLGLVGVPNFAVGSLVFDNDTRFYILMLVVLSAVYAFATRLTKSRTGRALRAIREDHVAAGMLGIHPFIYRMKIFLLVAGLSGFAGALQAHYLQICTPRMFDLTTSFEAVNMAIVGGYQLVLGSLVGTGILTLVAEGVRSMRGVQLLLYGVVLLVMLIYLPQGIVGWLKNKVKDRLFQPQEHDYQEKEVALSGAQGILFLKKHRENSFSPLLDVRNVCKAFGGLQVLSGISFSLAPGKIKALIGPNGAGKTTLFNIISGFIHPDSGRLFFRDEEISQLAPHQIARLGLGRSFQLTRVFGNLSLKENVLIGAHLKGHGGLFEDGISLPQTRRRDRALEKWCMACLEVVGLAQEWRLLAGELPLGQQKLLEIARALAFEPDLLLLDEPAAGLNDVEVKTLMDILRYINDQGVSVLLVEHKMEMVMKLAQEIVVMDFGVKISEGTPDFVSQDEKVIEVYLGAE